MKLIQLRYFLAACQYNNFTRAAEVMHVSQPSISSAVQELEREFGLTLLQRNNKRILLTREGMYFKERAEQLIEQADALSQVMCDMGNKRKRINLGVPPMIGTFIFPDLYSAFKKQFPEIQICSREGGSRELLRLLDNGELDLSILPSNHISSLEYHIVNMVQTETVFCVSRDHPLAARESVDIRTIEQEPLIMFHEGFYQNEFIKQRYEEAGCTPNIIHYSSQFYTIKEFIQRGIASGFMFRDIAKNVNEIAGIPLDRPLRVQISLVRSRAQHVYSDAMKFMDFVKQYYKISGV